MTHESEAAFIDHHVMPWVDATFPNADVEQQKWLPKTTCYCDVWIDLGAIVIAIEVENDAGSIRNGLGQAIEYSQNDPRAVPVVVTPEGHVEEAQVEALRSVCPIIEL